MSRAATTHARQVKTAQAALFFRPSTLARYLPVALAGGAGGEAAGACLIISPTLRNVCTSMSRSLPA